MAKIYNRAATSDNLVILGTREGAIQPINAPGWMDLRIGFFLSLTKSTNDDDPTAPMAETIGTGGTLQPQDRYWIGVKDSSQNFPTLVGTQFIGFSSTQGGAAPTPGNSILVSSDIGIGTTNAYFWRVYNPVDPAGAVAWITDGATTPAHLNASVSQHFPQDIVNAGGYTVMLGIRLTRPSPTSRVITALIKTDGAYSADMLYTNAPTKALLQTNLDPWPTGVAQLGPVSMSLVPTSLFCYWPFHNSKLRISAWGVLQAA